MLDRLRRWLSPEPLETTYAEAAEAFHERRGDAIDEAEGEATAIRDELAAALDDLEDGLAALDDVEDERGPVEDVLGNVATRRRSLVDGLSLPEDPTVLRDEVETFLEERADTSRKEAAVLQQIEFPDAYREAVERFEAAVDSLDRFVTERYDAVERAEELEELVARRREHLAAIEEDRERLEDAVDAVEEREADLEEARTDLEAFHESDEWSEYRALGDRLEQRREERRGVVSEVNEAVAATERGLKKLLYAVEHDDLAIDADHGILEELRDGRTETVLDRDPERVAAAAEAVLDAVSGEHVDGTDRERLEEGLTALSDLSSQTERLADLDGTIAELEDAVEDHGAPAHERELEERVERLERAVDEARERRERLREQLEEQRSAVEELESRIEAVLDDGVRGEVVLERADADRDAGSSSSRGNDPDG